MAANTPELLLSYSQQVCLGMHYLGSKGFVHRDLAARNIFVTKNDICKVSYSIVCYTHNICMTEVTTEIQLGQIMGIDLYSGGSNILTMCDK